MICRGTEETIPDTIRSLKAQGVDLLNVTLNQQQEEKLIVDTCKEVDLPFLMTKFEWCNDTGKSRQFNLQQIPEGYDWAIWVDSDDTIESAKLGITLRDVATKTALDGDDVVWMWYHYSSDLSGNPTNIFRRERLFRTALIGEPGSDRLHWKGIIHEVLMNCEHFKNTATEDVFIKHHPKEVDRKNRNAPQLEKALREDPSNPRFVMYMAHHYSASNQPALAYHWYLKFADDQTASPSERWQAYHYAAGCARMTGMFDEAERAAAAAIAILPEIVEPYIELGIINFYKKDYAKALYWFKESQGKKKGSDLVFFNPMYVTNEKDIHHALTLGAIGKFAEAVPLVKASYERDPKNVNLHEMYMKFREANLRDEVSKGLKALCVALLQHGELEKLKNVLSVLPWWFEETPEEYFVLKDGIGKQTAILDPEKNREFYKEFEQGGGSWCKPESPRYKWIVSRINRLGKNRRVLDVGGGEGVLAKQLLDEGHSVMVIEPNPHSRKILEQEKITNTNKFFADFQAKEKFNFVVLTEYLEHVPDYQKDFDKAMEIGERVIVTVPRPTRAAFANDFVQDHLRIFTLDELEKMVTTVPGRRIEEMLVAPSLTPDMNHVLMEISTRAWNKEAKSWKLFEAASIEEWNPHTKVPGGSELAFRELSTSLDSFKDTVFSYYNGDRCVYHGVPYRNHRFYPTHIPCDVLISSRTPSILAMDIPAKQKYLWAHDVGYGDQYLPELEEKIQGVFLESEFHKEVWLKHYPWSKKLYVVGCGISGNFAPEMKKDTSKVKFVWASSPVRGLDRMLNLWPEILKEFPEATLDLFFGWEWFDLAHGELTWPGLKQNITAAIESLPNLTYHGRVAHEEVVNFLRDEATVWLYPPNAFEEVYCALAVEAQAAGVLCFYRENGALPEVIADRGIPIAMDADNTSIVQCLREHMGNDALREKAAEWGRKQTWRKVAKAMRDIVNDNEMGDTRASST
jgi:glycosyltransferase involved in cell wall biosynthesis